MTDTIDVAALVERSLRERAAFMRAAGHDDDADLDEKAATALQSQADALAANETELDLLRKRVDGLLTAEASLATMREALEAIEQYPAKGNSRRDGDGYPKEVVYDKYAYRRLVDSYRIAARRALGGSNAE